MSTPVASGAGGPLENTPMRRYQILIIVFAILTAILDGFDTFAMAFVAPVVGREWDLDSSVLGVLLSSGFVGMAIGLFFISPIADVRGRRPVLLGSLILMTVGSLLSSFADTVTLLSVSRVVTGVGLGSAISLTTSIVAEFSNAKYRSLAVSVATQGLPVGHIIGGVASAILLGSLSWRAVFLTGAVAGAALTILLAVLLLESPSFLSAQQKPDALTKLNRVLQKLGHAPVEVLQPAPKRKGRASYRALFDGAAAKTTIQLMLANVSLAIASFYMLNWMPQFVTSIGVSASSASLVAAVSASIGLVGGLLLGAVAVFIPPVRVAASSMIVVGLSIALIGISSDFTAIILSAGLFSFFLAGAIGVFYAIITQSFSPLMRTTGTGLVLGVGRLAGAAGPAIAGVLFSAGLTRWEVSAMFALGPVAAGLILFRLKKQG